MTAPAGKQRIDTILVEKGLAESRERARALVMAGQVRIGDHVVAKPGTMVATDADIRVAGGLPFVSRGGLKLQHALQQFGIEASGKVVADIGASTGGFTDCLLQAGAARVYAIDVGYGQLDWKIRQDPRVVVMERTNIRHLESLPEPVDLATIDVSFISLALVLPVVKRLLRPLGEAVALVKPQFEAGKEKVGKGGVVRDPAVHREVLLRVARTAQELGFTVLGVTKSPITGPAGNVEFLMHLAAGRAAEGIDVGRSVETAIAVLT